MNRVRAMVYPQVAPSKYSFFSSGTLTGLRSGGEPGMYPVDSGKTTGKIGMESGKSALIASLKTVAKAYCEADGVPPKTLSWRIFNDGKKLDAILSDDADLMTANWEKAMGWLSTHWPEGAVWPENIVRPTPASAPA